MYERTDHAQLLQPTTVTAAVCMSRLYDCILLWSRSFFLSFFIFFHHAGPGRWLDAFFIALDQVSASQRGEPVMVHDADEGTPAGVVGLVRGLPARADPAREKCGNEHAHPAVGEPQRRDAERDAWGCRSSSSGDMGAASFGAAEDGRHPLEGKVFLVRA